MTFPLIISRTARRILPTGFRVRLRRSAAVRWMATKILSGIVHCNFPNSKFELYFDGYKNIGLGSDVSRFEQQEQRLVRTLLASNGTKVLWDIGANIGVWSLFLTSISGADAKITCFEPDPDNLRFLHLNRDKNDIKNWQIRPVAVSNRTGQAKFFSDPVCGSTGSLEVGHDFIGMYYAARRKEFPVDITTIDTEVARGAQPPQFMKIDVEGHELEVLEGAIQTLKKHRPFVIFETTRKPQELSALFRSIDYQLIDLDGRPIDSPQFNTLALPREVHLMS